jgi:arsenate reductase
MPGRYLVLLLTLACTLPLGGCSETQPVTPPKTAMKPKVLFLCTGNSCRSQMAEGWARHILGDRAEFYSAGIEAKGLNPNAVRVMQEAGVDITGQTSKLAESLKEVPLDLVVTVCGHADDTCPAFLREAKVVHVPFDDPPKLAETAATEEEALGHYRRVRDEIRAFVEEDLAEMLP